MNNFWKNILRKILIGISGYKRYEIGRIIELTKIIYKS